MKKRWKILIGIGICGLMATLAGLVFVSVLMLQAPDINTIDATPEGYLTTILDDREEKIGTLSGADSNRIYVDMSMISEDLQHAFVAIEDSRFYQHNGIDMRGILRAFVKGVTSGHFSQGASTITQQLLKNNVFTDWMKEENFYDKVCRKIQEQYLAVQLEQRYSKEWILENYMNTINLGGGTRGVQVASQYYFGKDALDLTLAQAALLAGITKNPTGYNPLKHPEESKERQLLVLKAMLEQGYIEEEAYEAAVEEDVMAAMDREHAMNGDRIFSWFEDELLNSIVSDLQEQLSCSETDAWNLVYAGGLTIYSTQNSDIQNICQEVVNRDDWYEDEEQVSVVILDPKNGSVKAIIGGRGEKTGSLVYDRATESIRQPGSTVKVIGEYAAGLERNLFTLGTVFDDAPYAYSNGTEIHNASDSYNGTTTIRRAIANSCNIVALKAYQEVGEDVVFDYLKAFGLDSLTDEDRHEALAIGGTHGGVTNLQLASAYNTLAAGGSYVKPYYYFKVLDHSGNVLLENTAQAEVVVSRDTAALLTSAMEDVFAYGTAASASFDSMALAGKSGTTNENRDLWLVGYSPLYTCSVWGGYDNNRAQENNHYVKEIWREIMSEVHEGIEYMDFSGTENMEQVTICRKCGKRALENICDNTIQGNMAVEEYFVYGTAPMGSCDCHVSVTICNDSGRRAGAYCPISSKTTYVYLTSATEGTNDVDYVVPGYSSEGCHIHKNLWDSFFGGGGHSQETDPDSNHHSDHGGSLWDFWGRDDDSEDHGNDRDDHSDGEQEWQDPEHDGWHFSDWMNSLFG